VGLKSSQGNADVCLQVTSVKGCGIRFMLSAKIAIMKTFYSRENGQLHRICEHESAGR
jgi:hypothetical protein